MAAYAATALIRDVHPRRPAPPHSLDTTVWTPPRVVVEADTIELTGRSFDDRLRDWWSNASANLSQTTFFLFDPESWR